MWRTSEKATLTGRIAGKEAQEFLQIIFTDVVVSFFQTGFFSSDSLLPEDRVFLHFSTIQYQYRARKADGSLDNPLQVGWDLKRNRPALKKHWCRFWGFAEFGYEIEALCPKLRFVS